MTIDNVGAIQFNDYGAGTFTGTSVADLGVDSSGNIIEVTGGGTGGPYLPLSAGDSFPLTGELRINGGYYSKLNFAGTTDKEQIAKTLVSFGGPPIINENNFDFSGDWHFKGSDRVDTAGDEYMSFFEYSNKVGSHYSQGGEIGMGFDITDANRVQLAKLTLIDYSYEGNPGQANKAAVTGINMFQPPTPTQIPIGFGNAMNIGFNNHSSNPFNSSYGWRWRVETTVAAASSSQTKPDMIFSHGDMDNGQAGTDIMRLTNDGELKLFNYGSGTFTGTVAKSLAVDSSGNIIETTAALAIPGLLDGTSLYVGTVPPSLSGNPVSNSTFGVNAGVAITTAVRNTLIGSLSGDALTTGGDNVAIGYDAASTITGSNNTCVGSGSGTGIVAGTDNTMIGKGTTLAANASNSIVIGSGAGSGSIGSNEIMLGNSSISDFKCQVALTVLSDKRDKVNFETIPHGLDFVDKLKPTSYEFKKEANRSSVEGNGYKRYGFVAQDILELEGENPVIINDKDTEKLLYTEANLIPVLVKAIQELSAKVTALENA